MNKIFNKNSYIFFVVPFILGFITSFSFSPYNYIYVNFLTFPAFIYLLNVGALLKFNKKFFFLIGWFFGFGYFLSGLYWISISLTHDESFKYLIPFTIVLVPAFLAIFYGIGTLILKNFVSKKISFVLFFSIVFSILEFLRGNILSGFPWNLIAYSWIWSLETIQIISIIGTYAFNLISITIFSLPIIFFVEKKYNKKKYGFTFLLLFLFVINYFFGFIVLSKSKENNFRMHDFIIKIVSPNIKLKEFIYDNNNDAIIQKLIKLSNPQADQKTIFIWPEGMFPGMYLNEIKKYQDVFSDAFSNLHLVIFGINKLEYKDKDNLPIENVYNSLVIIDNYANLIDIYNKNKLVPFGEFLPLEKYFHKIGIKKITHGYKSFSKGQVRHVININNDFFNIKLLPLICYEIIYPGKINLEKKKIDLIINISEDGWFGNSIGIYQHFNKVIYRAIEEGNYVARSANNGISAFINPNGKILKSLQPNDAGVITVNLPIHENNTIFSKYGNKIFLIIIFLYIVLIFYFNKVEKNEKEKLFFHK